MVPLTTEQQTNLDRILEKLANDSEFNDLFAELLNLLAKANVHFNITIAELLAVHRHWLTDLYTPEDDNKLIAYVSYWIFSCCACLTFYLKYKDNYEWDITVARKNDCKVKLTGIDIDYFKITFMFRPTPLDFSITPDIQLAPRNNSDSIWIDHDENNLDWLNLEIRLFNLDTNKNLCVPISKLNTNTIQQIL